jgi:hypothetical protein
MMVVQPGERNAFDQRWLSTRIWETAGVRVERRTLRQVAEQGTRDDAGHVRCAVPPVATGRCLRAACGHQLLHPRHPGGLWPGS